MKFFDRKLLKNFDFSIVMIIFLLTMFGVVFLINSQAAPFTGEEAGFSEIFAKLDFSYASLHLLWFGLGLALMLLICVLDYHTLSEFINVAYVMIVVILLLLVVFGQSTAGAKGWIKFGQGERGLQPAELGKLVLIVMTAKIAAQSVERDGNLKSFRDIIKILAFAAVPIGLVMAQRDTGTAIVYIVILAAILFSAGLSYKVIIPMSIALAVAAVVAFFTIMPDYAKARIYNFLGMELPQALKSYDNANVTAALDSIRAGGKTGIGFFSPRSLSKLGWLFADHTDFIFASGIEVVGFAGGLMIIVLYFALIMRMLYLATKAKDKLGSYIIIGVIAMEFTHIFENIGMNIGLMPVTGIPLPFISYGGSSMWANMLALGLVLNVAMRRPTKRYNMQSITT